jgi:hypothetical protein
LAKLSFQNLVCTLLSRALLSASARNHRAAECPPSSAPLALAIDTLLDVGRYAPGNRPPARLLSFVIGSAHTQGDRLAGSAECPYDNLPLGCGRADALQRIGELTVGGRGSLEKSVYRYLGSLHCLFRCRQPCWRWRPFSRRQRIGRLLW